jgi:DNA-binding MarR family transcriptional regulator
MKANTIRREDVILNKLVEEITLLTHELARERHSVPLLTITQESVLRVLKENGQLALKELKVLLNLDTYQISRLLASVESFRDGKSEISLIRREPHGADKRQWVISLSADGEKVLGGEIKRRVIRLRAMIEPLTDNERNALVSIVKKMTSSLRHKRAK